MLTKTTKSNLPAIAFAIAALASIQPSAALANGDTEAKSEYVHYNDLNLANHDGVKALDRRLDRAVKRVCGSYETYSINDRALAGQCEIDAHKAIAKQREYVIAQATGQTNGKRWADNASHNASPVTLSE